MEKEISNEVLAEPTLEVAPESSWAPSLEVKTGDNEGRIAAVDEPKFIIGRQKRSGLKLDDKVVSRKHAVIEQKDGRFIIRDLGSRWGTKINGVKVEEAELKLGDQIEIAGNMILFDLAKKGAKSAKRREPIKLAILVVISLALVSFGALSYFKYRVNQNLSRPGGDVLARIMHHYDQGIFYYNKMDKSPVKNRDKCVEEMKAVIQLDPKGKTRFSRSATRILEGLE
jgi:hypothetical protein